eukprot:3626927-Pyramimonas_sp.AAC.1
MVHCCGLLCAIVENVPGIKTVLADGRGAPIDQHVRLLEQHVPEFTRRVETLKLVDYLCPQNRVRVFLVGLRRNLGDVPRPLMPFGTRLLAEALASGLPCMSRASLTEAQQRNLKAYENRIRSL